MKIRKCQNKYYLESSKLFHRALRKAERDYNKQLQDTIESVCTDNPRTFWEYIKKLGPKVKHKIPQEVYDKDGNISTDINDVLNNWKEEFESLYKQTCDTFDENFYEHVKELLRLAEYRMLDPLYMENPELNQNISRVEIDKVVNNLKNRKATGIDKIPNEVLKNDSVKNCLHKFFQYYFDTGLLPSCWLKSVIKPIPKSKTSDPRVPLNYRGVNLLSCIYKTYSCVINKRLLTYLERYHLIEDEQNGFREGRSCLEHIYTLYSIIKNRKNQLKDTFVAFIDFTKCFDLIDRDVLFYKLTEYGIDGKMYYTLKKMYTNTMSCVNFNDILTEWFYTNNGCRQGDVTSPTAFSIVINDLLKELKYSGIGVNVGNMIICALAYADDIVLMADNPNDLQRLLNIMSSWCNKWRFIVNPAKSNIVHFRNAPKVQTDFNFQLGTDGPRLEIVDSYKYLGVFFDRYLTFNTAAEVLGDAAGRALGGMINKYKSMKEMGYTTYTKLFDSLVARVMDYGSAIWGSKTFDNLDQVQYRAIRFFTGVHRLCPVSGLIGDMGWTSNRERWKVEALRLWNRLIALNDDRLVKRVLEWDVECHRNDNKSNFAARIKQIMSEIKMKDLYDSRSQIDIVHAKKMLLDWSSNNWSASLDKYKSKLDVYKCIKTNFGVEKYLELNLDKYEKSLLSQTRYGILPLREETGRFKNERREDRICTLCNLQKVENVLHFIEPTCAYCTMGSYASLSVRPSVRLSVCLSVTLLKIHISESIIGMSLKLYHSVKPL